MSKLTEDERALGCLMLALGFTYAQVGSAIERTDNSVKSLVSRGSLWPEEGVKPLEFDGVSQRPWSEEEDTLLDLLVQRDWRDLRLATLLRRSVASIQSRKHRLGTFQPNSRVAAHRKVGSKMRPCLCCKGIFRSEGSGNRMCYECRRDAAEIADYYVAC